MSSTLARIRGHFAGSQALLHGVLAFALCWSFVGRASAESAPAPAPAPAPATAPARRWYGWQTLIADGAGATLLIASRSFEAHREFRTANGLVWAGIGTLALGAPVVHAAHARWGAAAGSFGLRLGLPALTAFALRDCSGECGGGLLLLAVAVTVPIALDASVLSWERAPERQDTSPRLRIRPYASAQHRELQVGLVGRF